MKTKPLTEATSAAILDAAARLMITEGRADPPLSQVAAAAGVSRQSVYLGFGGRAGLLAALLERAARQSNAVTSFEAMTVNPVLNARRLTAMAEAWMDHLAEIHPVVTLLDAASLSDPDALAAGRAFAQRWRGAFEATLSQSDPVWALRDSLTPSAAADLLWSAMDVRAWRGLVVESGWTPEAFRSSRVVFLRRMILMRIV